MFLYGNTLRDLRHVDALQGMNPNLSLAMLSRRLRSPAARS